MSDKIQPLPDSQLRRDRRETGLAEARAYSHQTQLQEEALERGRTGFFSKLFGPSHPRRGGHDSGNTLWEGADDER